MEKLSKMQQKIYDFIVERVEVYGYPPSVREMGEHVGLKSPSTVHFHLKTLERLGYITRAEGKTRAISLAPAEPKPDGVPLLGDVAAGSPILAVEEAIGYIPYDTGDNSGYFALRIRGQSMIRAGILDGDIVIVRAQSTARHGEIVIALLGDEATCKRLSLHDGEVWLLPENEEYEPINGMEARILGKVTAVIRTYGF